MKTYARQSLNPALLLALIIAVCFSLGVNPYAQTKAQLPSRTSHVNDFAGVVDAETRQRLENLLSNLTQKSGIQFDIATVDSTGSQDIFDYSRDLATEWNVGARHSIRKSLLLVMAVKEKTLFTQFSKSVQKELPEGVLGEMTQRMRKFADSGQFGERLTDGVQYFVSKLAAKLGFSINDLDQSPSQIATAPSAEPTRSPAVATDHVRADTSSGSTDVAGPAPPPAAKAKNRREELRSSARNSRKATTPAEDEDEEEEVELTLTLPLDERVKKLKDFLKTHPNSKARPRAFELLVSAHAALGDKRLKEGDAPAGVQQLLLAINEAPSEISEQLFSGVISQIPLNLYLRGERTSAFEAAQAIEAKFSRDPKRLLAIAGFYLGIEQGEEAARIAREAVALAPNLAEAHHALGLGLHISLRLEEAVAEYRRALELDPNSKGTRRSLADLSRAAGKAEEALVLYREHLTSDPGDKAAKAGLVLSLLELGRTDEANTELANALQEDPRNLPLLAGAAYWFAAHDDTQRALELANKAVEIEPRYTWSQIALARALLGQKRPLDAERAIRFARLYGKFPTLDFELANVLVSLGLYDEAAEALKQSFWIKEGQIETRLAGRLLTRAPTFNELLASERRASIFQFAPAETSNNSKILKSLLVFSNAITKQADSDKLDEAAAVAAAEEFAAGTDDMRAFRQLYAADRLLKKGIGFKTAYELVQEARGSIDVALAVPASTVAVQADELRDIRARAISAGTTPDIPDAPRNALSNILRGRVEDLLGWLLFNQDQAADAVDHLKRAVNILPEGTPSWRAALWHLGAALDQIGNGEEALNYYIKSYASGEADPVRRAVIEQLYRRLKGSLVGLDERMGATPIVSSGGNATANASPETGTNKPGATETPSPATSRDAAAASSGDSASASNPVAETGARPIPASKEPVGSPSSAGDSSSSTARVPAPESPSSPTPEASPTPSPTDTPSESPSIPVPQRSIVKVSGRVKDSSNNGMGNVVVVLISPRGTVLASTTDAEGRYSFTVPISEHSYRIIPSKEGFSFDPVDRVLAGLTENQKSLDFIGSPSRAP